MLTIKNKGTKALSAWSQLTDIDQASVGNIIEDVL